MIDWEFLFDNQLSASLERLIKSADKKLTLISPFIDLDERIKGALLVHRSEEHTSELQSRFGISYAVFCLKKKNNDT